MSNPSLLCVPYRFKTSTLYSQIPDSGLGDFVVTRSASNAATRVNAAGFIETVADNVPRLDYPLGGITAGCPALLVEPSAQNQMLQSQNLSLAFPSQANTSVSADVSISPDGTQNADRLTFTTSAGYRLRTFSIVSGTSYTASLFYKNVDFTTGNIFTVKVSDGVVAPMNVNINPVTNTITQATGPFTNVSSSIENYGNGWYRVRISGTASNTGGGWYEVTTNATKSIDLWGFQFETGLVATSYIPTTTAAITRGAETISKTGISSLLGQTSGTFYLDASYTTKGNTTSSLWAYIQGTPTTNNIGLAVSANTVRSTVNSQSDILLTPSTVSGVKIAWAYDGSGVVCFVNGVQYALTNGGSQIITSMDRFTIDMSTTAGTRLADVRFRAISCYQSRLTNAQLQSLTQ